MNFKCSFIDQPKMIAFPTLYEKKLSLLFICLSNQLKKPTKIKPKIVQYLHFPLKKTKTLTPKTENHEPFLLKCLKLILYRN